MCIRDRSIVVNTLSALSNDQKISSKIAKQAMKKYKIKDDKPIPTKV